MKRDPKIYACQPCQIDLEPGDHLWCACGLSGHQPFCDFSHKGTGIMPVKFHISESRTVWLCNCKHTGHPPFCDGSHEHLSQRATATGT